MKTKGARTQGPRPCVQGSCFSSTGTPVQMWAESQRTTPEPAACLFVSLQLCLIRPPRPAPHYKHQTCPDCLSLVCHPLWGDHACFRLSNSVLVTRVGPWVRSGLQTCLHLIAPPAERTGAPTAARGAQINFSPPNRPPRSPRDRSVCVGRRFRFAVFPGRESRSTCRLSEGCGDRDGGRRITPRKSPSQRGSATICNSSDVQQRQQRAGPIDFHGKRQKTYCCDQRYK